MNKASVIGICVAMLGLTAILLTIVIMFVYFRRKVVLHGRHFPRAPRPPMPEPGSPEWYFMMREPPPMYSSHADLTMIPPEMLQSRPPPAYSSNPNLLDVSIGAIESPPDYSSRPTTPALPIRSRACSQNETVVLQPSLLEVSSSETAPREMDLSRISMPSSRHNFRSKIAYASSSIPSLNNSTLLDSSAFSVGIHELSMKSTDANVKGHTLYITAEPNRFEADCKDASMIETDVENIYSLQNDYTRNHTKTPKGAKERVKKSKLPSRVYSSPDILTTVELQGSSSWSTDEHIGQANVQSNNTWEQTDTEEDNVQQVPDQAHSNPVAHSTECNIVQRPGNHRNKCRSMNCLQSGAALSPQYFPKHAISVDDLTVNRPTRHHPTEFAAARAKEMWISADPDSTPTSGYSSRRGSLSTRPGTGTNHMESHSSSVCLEEETLDPGISSPTKDLCLNDVAARSRTQTLDQIHKARSFSSGLNDRTNQYIYLESEMSAMDDSVGEDDKGTYKLSGSRNHKLHVPMKSRSLSNLNANMTLSLRNYMYAHSGDASLC